MLEEGAIFVPERRAEGGEGFAASAASVLVSLAIRDVQLRMV